MPGQVSPFIGGRLPTSPQAQQQQQDLITGFWQHDQTTEYALTSLPTCPTSETTTHLVTTIPEDKPAEEALLGGYWEKYGK